MNNDKTAPHWPHGTDYPEGGPHAEGPGRVEEIRERWTDRQPMIRFMESDAPFRQAVEDIAYLLTEVERLTANLAQTRAAAREQLAEKDRIIGEVMEEMEVLRDMGPRLSCPDCGWAGQESDLVQKMRGALCPSCARVLKWKGGLRVPVAEVKPLAIDDLRPLMVEGWKMPEAPGPQLEPAAWWVPGVGWVTQWVTHFGGSTPHNIPSPFRRGERPTVDMFRTLGFVTYE